jgi:hypothetical protein
MDIAFQRDIIPWATIDFLTDLKSELHGLMWETMAGMPDEDRILRIIAKTADLCKKHEDMAKMNLILERLVHDFVKETEVRT